MHRSRSVVLGLVVAALTSAVAAACADPVDRATEKNASSTLSHDDDDAKMRARAAHRDGGDWSPGVGRDNLDPTADGGLH